MHYCWFFDGLEAADHVRDCRIFQVAAQILCVYHFRTNTFLLVEVGYEVLQVYCDGIISHLLHHLMIGFILA